ncbi:MAG: response regulator transcription factor [Betaproteobacteria bacterium]|nr:response regulator transcription factor [Betaproteobacteria bacterium]
MEPLRILLADDHALFRAGLRALLRELPDAQVIAEVGNGNDAVELTRQHHPDVVVMDISMKGLNGLEATARIKAEAPATKVIVLSMHDSEDYVAQALRAGACGYLLKDSAEPELELALRAVVRGETYLSPRVSKPVVDAYVRSTGADRLPPSPLTARQREILQLIAEGHSTKAIAGQLRVSVKTVETHRAQIMERLEIHDVPGLVRYAIRNGLAALGK